MLERASHCLGTELKEKTKLQNMSKFCSLYLSYRLVCLCIHPSFILHFCLFTTKVSLYDSLFLVIGYIVT